VRRVCSRGLSVGADGVLSVERVGPDRIRVRFHNPDGSEAFCGNGSRCAARYASLRGMTGARLMLETAAGDVPARVDGDRVTLRLVLPSDAGACAIDLGDTVLEGRRIVAGTPHFVTFVPDPETVPLGRWGPRVAGDPRFAPAGTNLDVARADGTRVLLRTWEKGVDRETLACGSGAIAAAAAVRARRGGDRFTVVPRSRIPLDVTFVTGSGVDLRGDARLVLEGRLGAEATRWDDGEAERGG
jgi:diaminopimelate epimerase